MRILLVEDEASLREPMAAYVRSMGYDVDEADSIEAAREALYDAEPDLVILDVMLPEGVDAGFEFASELREAGFDGPVLFITARDAVEDRVRGLDLGGDDYLTKPFSLEELAARVRALLRRQGSVRRSFFERGPLRVDYAARKVHWQGREVALSGREFALIELFSLHPDRVYSAEELLERLFPGTDSGLKIVRVYVHRLRTKLGPEVVQTVAGGYRLGLEP
ncbi:response regulator transcription factor [Oceanithermus profundus]|uniref:Two component transcriptional regulator, winged helix family n=1 Tax=Oceanithermus profundus (strain DSM 14977 / NBRC 100410 / VKM B-2274 / 506) TaxID=670487 RepID=E4U718_OCEP5|nr:response regulator transcription factor [Oceanithermus profundus]ADR36021.1 two component transcriptional regulator, winged helix family [Oceanithermus profundus DSM 14977]